MLGQAALRHHWWMRFKRVCGVAVEQSGRMAEAWNLKLDFSHNFNCMQILQKSEDLTHEALIKRAVSLVTNSANTYLSQTTLALVDTLTEYTKALYTLISIQKRYVGLIGKLSPNEEDAIWQLVIRSRVEVNEKQEDCKRFESNWMNAVNLSERAAEAAYVAGMYSKKVNEKQEDCKRFESNWMNAVNLSERAAEAAYVAGADQASVFARSHLQMSQTQVEEARQLSLKAERMLAEVQVDEIRRTAQQAQTSESAAGLEEEIPDAYLRED
ncbi:UNVERIFIED_CONTAM: hypothetical protein FKN15_002271 [Acipenser sinensis]